MPNQTYLPLKEAAKKHNVEEKVLTQLIAAGMIEAVEENGETLVAVDKNGNGNHGKGVTTKEEIIATKFAHLRDQSISAYSAQKEYGGIHRSNFIRWARAGYIRILREEGRILEMDAADVAYCAHVYTQKKAEYDGKIAGVKIFDKAGNPYQVKYPDLSARRREEWL